MLRETALHISRSADPERGTACSRIEGCGATKLYVGVRPTGSGDIAAQVREVYQRLDELLAAQGTGPRAVISEKLFFSDLATQSEVAESARADYYAHLSSTPVTTYLQQPPCAEGVLFELQARVIFANAEDEVSVRDIEGLTAPARGKVVSYRGYDHIYLHNLFGGQPGDDLPYAEQMEQIFNDSEAILEREGLTFKDVIRTWLYLDEMERDYDDLNRVRSAFFARVGVEPPPASTGIQGGVYPLGRGGTMDLYALRSEKPVHSELMHAPTLNEAWSYGSRFARGMAITREDRKVLYISGTASINTEGQVVHVGDIEGQVRRMLLNVEELLEGSGATPTDIVRATTYLKESSVREPFARIYREMGFPTTIPHTVCRADVCRPDWLCEIEVAAILKPVL